MKTYIALLRGINVSGQKKILMEDLRNICSNLGWSEVKTYIQSGNVVYQSSQNNAEEMSQDLIHTIKKKYDFEVPVLVLTPEYIGQILKSIPFENFDPKRLYMTFLSARPNESSLDEINNAKRESEQVVIKDRIIYLHCPEGYADTKLSNNFFEKKLKVSATTRNWNTTRKLFEMANA